MDTALVGQASLDNAAKQMWTSVLLRDRASTYAPTLLVATRVNAIRVIPRKALGVT